MRTGPVVAREKGEKAASASAAAKTIGKTAVADERRNLRDLERYTPHKR
jgi:hypothetical protein